MNGISGTMWVSYPMHFFDLGCISKCYEQSGYNSGHTPTCSAARSGTDSQLDLHLQKNQYSKYTVVKPPRLTNADDFDNWKFRYENFAKYKDSSIWKSIEKGPQVPMVRNEKNEFVPKDPDLYVSEEILQKEKDEKAYAGLTMALS
ncbi:hypothetical protein L1987_18435 [Smallanthus sonchifolius]|uniref:Uncharacterized protein n=1 Tax=Smallanthus sonchifolius TaxID=185202 RepID=A0ACB9J096_9ASTR|nr:hypothetical protein L1987_18435 [Smallanthus sonchifolius]